MSARIYIATLMREHGDTGVQAHFSAFALYLEGMGQSVEVVTPLGRDIWFLYPLFALRFVLERLHAPSAVRWYRFTRLLALKYRLSRRLAGGGNAIVYAQCPVSAEAAMRVRSSPLQTVVMVVHFNVSQADEWVGQGLLRSGSRTWRAILDFEARVLPTLDGIVFVSCFMRDLVLARVPAVASVKFEVIPNFVKDPGAPAWVGTHAQSRLTLVMVGTLENRKNQRYALNLLAAARTHCSSLELSLIGDGPDRVMLERHAASLGLQEQVHFLGKVSGAARLLPNYDAYIHTAKIENLPISIIEAMSCGLPIFACPVGGIPELFSDGRQGAYLPLDDVAAAGRMLGLRMNDAVARLQMGRASRERFESDFNEDVVAHKLNAFLLAAAHDRKTAAAPERSIAAAATP